MHFKKKSGDHPGKMVTLWILRKKNVDVSIYHGDRMGMISNDVNCLVVSELFIVDVQPYLEG